MNMIKDRGRSYQQESRKSRFRLTSGPAIVDARRSSDTIHSSRPRLLRGRAYAWPLRDAVPPDAAGMLAGRPGGLRGAVAARPVAPPRRRAASTASRRPSSSSGCAAGPATSRPTTPSPTRRPNTAAPIPPSPRARPACASASCCPRHAAVSDRFTLVRSLSHTGGGHPAGSLQMLGGDPDAQDKLRPVYPDFMSVAAHQRAARAARCPTTSASTRSSATTTSPSPGRPTSGRPTSRSPSWATPPRRASACPTSASPATRQAPRLRERRRLRAAIRRHAAGHRPVRRGRGRWTGSRSRR